MSFCEDKLEQHQAELLIRFEFERACEFSVEGMIENLTFPLAGAAILTILDQKRPEVCMLR